MDVKHNSAGEKPLVLHVVATLAFGGLERHMETIALHRAASSMIHVFCAIGNGGAMEQRLLSIGVEVICLGKPFRIPSISAVLALCRLIRRLRPRVVQSHGSEPNFHALLAAWLCRVPARVGEEIGIPDHGRIARIAFRAVYGMAHRVFGVSQTVADWLVQSGEVPLRKVQRLYCPVVLPELRQEQSNDHSAFRLVNVGRLEPSKRLDTLVDVVRNLRAEGVPAELWLIGDGSQRQMLEHKVRESGIAKHVQFHGFQREPEQLMRQCDIFVLACLSEGFGLAMVEAMGCGLPVVATSTGGPGEIIEDGLTGWLLSEVTERQLTDTLLMAFRAGPEALRMMGRSARASVERRFCGDAYLAELDSIYTDLAKAGAEIST